MPLTTSEIHGLPIIPLYVPGELTQAHFQRIADVNFMEVSQVSGLLKKFAASNYPHLEKHLVKPTLANLMGHPDDLVEQLCPSDYFVAPSSQASARQVCPICLAEGTPALLLLAEPAYGICHFHRVTHVHRCASCNRRLMWGRGDYFHCKCGFDLRLSPTICVDSDTASLYLSCLSGHDVNTVHEKHQLGGYEQAGERLRSTLAYLMQDFSIQSSVAALQREASPTVQKEALHWLGIGMQIGCDSVKLTDVVAGIEARHIWTPAQPEWSYSSAQHLMESISWEPLRLLARTAQSQALEYRPACSASVALEAYEGDRKHLLERLAGNEGRLSSFLLDELLFEVRAHQSHSFDEGPQNIVRLDALVELTRNLRWIDECRWDLQIPIATKDEVLSFIAAGAFHPSIALAIEHWHVDQRDVAEVFQRIWLGRWPEVLRGGDDYFVLMFDRVFKPCIKPSDWFCLPLVDIERRVMALLHGDSLSISGWPHAGTQLALPLGFCAFLSTEECGIYCDPQNYRLDSMGLLCSTWQEAAAALINACKRAQDHMKRLEAWPQLAAQVAEKFHLGDPWDESGTRSRSKANSLIARFHPYPYKSLNAALQAQPGRTSLEPDAFTDTDDVEAAPELQLADQGA
nr:hypothetical protein [uncultured Rhodoferax sp.]